MDSVIPIFLLATAGLVSGIVLAVDQERIPVDIEICNNIAEIITTAGPVVCTSTVLSTTDSVIAGKLLGLPAGEASYTISATRSNGDILDLQQSSTEGIFSLYVDLAMLAGADILLSARKGGIELPPTKLVVGQIPPTSCMETVNNRDFLTTKNKNNKGAQARAEYPFCGTGGGGVFPATMLENTVAIFKNISGVYLGDAYYYVNGSSVGLAGFRMKLGNDLYLVGHTYPLLKPTDKNVEDIDVTYISTALDSEYEYMRAYSYPITQRAASR
ncbi:hypothetical protein FBY04_1331 [Pseudomonas sp. SJZ080]|uniref:hypothetical protein n=1 Tax=Pseudomonas sp. SJZ080 TaxID=2572888 RepID=UPI00119C59DA|nr:hypothetical protein [Pseudomonas sp. SJZ080]TWC46100.1 hypothetical protein FBY04_1331 [Pseudomonas sp. SJZ080]